jgi:hypothetical protein
VKRWLSGVLVFTVLGAFGVVRAQEGYEPGKGYTFDYMEGKKANIGADVRLRWEDWSRNTLNQNWSVKPPLGADKENGPDVSYLRVQERVWGTFDVMPDTKLFIRLANRWQDFSSSYNDSNN